MAIASFDNYPHKTLKIELPIIKGNYILIKISNKISGWTISKIYGAGTINVLAIATYETIIYYVDNDNNKKELTKFNLTRDGFYDLGIDPKTKKSKIVNRSSEPLKEINIKAIATVDYADTYGAYALDPFDIEELPRDFDYFTDGEPISYKVKRKSPKTAADVMIHIGGYYTKAKGSKHRIGGTYGCYGVISPKMVFSTWKEANAWEKKAIDVINDKNSLTPLDKGTPSNREQNRLVNTINSAIKKYGNNKTEIYVNIQKNSKRRKIIK